MHAHAGSAGRLWSQGIRTQPPIHSDREVGSRLTNSDVSRVLETAKGAINEGGIDMNAYRTFLLASTMTATTIAAGTAYADEPQQVETVTVTALRRAEPLQNTPASVSVITAETIET